MGLEERKTAEAPKVRLVRCPKCENLLPELPDIPVYQCGGCGVVLKAKKKGFLEDGMSEITDAVKGASISGNGGSGSGSVDVSKVELESTQENEPSELRCFHDEKVASGGCSTSRAGDREVVSDSDSSRRGKERIRRMDSIDEDYRSHATSMSRNVNRGQNYDLNGNEIQYARFNGAHSAKEARPPVELLRRWPEMNQTEVTASIGPVKDVSTQLRLNKFNYNGEEPSNHDLTSCYEQVERTRYNDSDFDGLARVKNLENDRKKLLRKLDELQDQISRSSDMASKQKENIDADRRRDFSNAPDPYGRFYATYIPEGLTTSHYVNNQKLFPYDKESSHLSHTPNFIPCTSVHGSSALSSYTQRGFQQEFHGNGDTYRPEMICRPSLPPQSQYIHQSYHEQFPYYYGDANHDHLMLHRHENLFHQPGCSCVHCYNKNWLMAPNFDRPAFLNQMSRIEPSNPMLHHPLNPTPNGLQAYGFGGSSLYQMPSQQPISLKSSDHERPRKMMVAHRNGPVCHPVAGGAPFITCCNCFELLHLPRKCISSSKIHHKMKCGACSSIISFEVGDKGFIGSVSVHVDQVPTEIDDGSSGTMDENVIYWPGDTNSADMNGCSNDFNDLQGKKSISDEDPLSSPLSFIENGCGPENATSRKHDSLSSELHLPEDTPSIMPSKTYPDQRSDNSVISQHDKGNKSKRTEKERVVIDRSTSRQTSVTDAATATEIDLPFNESAHICASHDSVETDKDHSKAHKGSESFFAGFIKKSFRDFKKLSQSVEDGESQVYVNGHIIPDRAIKKAEKFAGPIQPGEYWYDIHAGFWGIIGHQCMGIIMPQILEFNYPMPENCSAGDTGIFVNGRELHKKDLDLLSGRGLPITRNRSYAIEISGKVTDEQTGEELDGLGKLAPTVERAKHGFGMKVPRHLS